MINKVSRIAIICTLEETIRDEVKRMCDTDSLAELDTMALHAKENIENLRSVKYKALVKESAEVVKDLVEADRKTEPQTEVVMPKKCKGCDSASKIIEAYSRGFMDGADAVKDMTQTFTADGIVFAKMDEPQTETKTETKNSNLSFETDTL